MSHIELTVVIVSYKNLEVLIDCLNSIYKYNDIGEKLEVIIVDNSPEENLYNYISTNFKQVKIIKNDNKGFGEGNNVGAKISQGEFLLFLNPDTILIEPIFNFAIEQFKKNLDLGLFGVKLLDIDLKRNMSFYLIDKHGFIASQFIKFFNKLDLFIDGKMFIAGADIFIRKRDFIEVGMFDESIFMYNEEPDLTKRIKILNKKTAYFKNKRIIHLEGKTVENNDAALQRRLESAKYYSGKYRISFQKQIKQEIRYNYLKLLIYKVFKNKNKYKRTKSMLSILNKYNRI